MKLIRRVTIAAVLSCAVATTVAADVVVTIKPLHSLVQGVMGETGTAQLLVKGNSSPHGGRLTPSYLRMLTEANVVFLIDGNFESFLQKMPPDSLVPMVEVSQLAGITLHDKRDGGVWEEGEHGHDDDHDGHDDHDDMHAGHDHSGQQDLHLWLDTRNAKVIVAAVASQLSRMMPENSAVYRANAEKMTMRLDVLMMRLSEMLAGVEAARFFTYHDAMQYFEKQYGLEGAGGLVWSPGESLSAARMSALRAKIAGGEVACVLREPQFSSRPIDTLIEDSGVRSGVIDVLGADLPPGEGQYFMLMENLAQTLVACLGSE